MSVKRLRVAPRKLTNVCDPRSLGFETTREVEPLEGTIGQERAVSALEMGLDIDEPGFNLFIAGLPGTGRNTALRAYVERAAAKKPTPPEWGYVYNFQESSQPVAISLPCGMMRLLANDMQELVEGCRLEIPRAFESDDYSNRIGEVLKDIQAKRQELSDAMDRTAQEAGFALTSTGLGVTPVPIKDDKPFTREDQDSLDEAEREQLRERADAVQRSLSLTMAKMRRLNKDAANQTREVDKDVVRFALTPVIEELKAKYVDFRAVSEYLGQVESDIVDHVDIFKPAEEPAPAPIGLAGATREEDVYARYRVNCLVDNTSREAAPVVFEHSPTYYNLFGRIDYKALVGTLVTDLSMIKAGAMHRANGGYLVLQARDLLTSPLSWETLKRTLRSGEIRVENIGEQYGPLPSETLRPQPIPINTKIIVVGTPEILRTLQMVDEDFRRYFKVTADFDTLMDRNRENLAKYAAFVSARCRDSNLRPFHNTAVARVIDYSVRLVGHQEKLTTRFMNVAEIITEAHYWAGMDGADTVMGDHVVKAIDQRQYRSSLMEDRLRELIEEDTIRIATEGRALGQVNGLAILSSGDYVFGKPSRITARVSLGRGQVVNVERETRMSGRIHDKGFLILTGYLQGKYGQDKPLSLSASIGFEQTYSEVDGDSASSTELYALLSELSGLPIAQGTAVTGSVNQNGDVQAVGGATQKIEGFFDICKAKGLTDNQGVVVPRDNVRNLVLKEEVIEAVRDNKFHIYGVSTIDEGIEVLTGVPAGEPQEDGTYPEGTVHYLVEKRLTEIAIKVKEFGRTQDKDANDQQGNAEA
jgi:lon-related putative ATP-dependent protease